MKERAIIIDIERCVDNNNQEAECPNVGDDQLGHLYSFKVCGKPMIVDLLSNGESLVKPAIDSDGDSPNSGEKTRKERRMLMSAKKPPKPPRPPRGLSLDAADQKLIKEISELLMIKRARIERMKALKKTKAAKGMPSSTSSTANLIPMLCTILFCIALIFQGCHPWGIFTRNSSSVALQDNRNLSSRSSYMLAKVRSPNLLVPGSNYNPVGGEGEAIR